MTIDVVLSTLIPVVLAGAFLPEKSSLTAQHWALIFFFGSAISLGAVFLLRETPFRWSKLIATLLGIYGVTQTVIILMSAQCMTAQHSECGAWTALAILFGLVSFAVMIVYAIVGIRNILK